MIKIRDIIPGTIREVLQPLDSYIGHIVHLHCPFTKPDPKHKFLILLSVDPTLLFMLNSTVHKFIKNNPVMNVAQIKITPENYIFLDHDSYINCAEVITSFDSVQLNKQIRGNPDCVKAKLNEETKQKIRNVVNRSKTIEPIFQSIILKNIR